MDVSVKADFKAARKKIKRIHRKQVPFATAGALTTTAFESRTVAVKAMGRFLDRPTPSTKKSLVVDKANKYDLRARVYFQPWAWKYMKFQVVGGSRSRGENTAVPAIGLGLNKYGNIKGRRGGLLKGQNYAASIGGGLSGIFKKKGRKKRQLIAVLTDRVTYKPRYPFHDIVERAARKRFVKNFDKAMAYAISTAR